MLGAVAVFGGVPSAQARSDLGTDLDAILAAPQLAGAATDVRDVRSGEQLYARNPDQPVIPASNNKLQTSAAAFGVLGPHGSPRRVDPP